jgi:hypothetical protein
MSETAQIFSFPTIVAAMVMVEACSQAAPQKMRRRNPRHPKRYFLI